VEITHRNRSPNGITINS